MYRLIEVKQKKLLTSQITLAEMEDFVQHTFGVNAWNQLSEHNLVVLIDVKDHDEQMSKLRWQLEALQDANDSLVATMARARQTANRLG